MRLQSEITPLRLDSSIGLVIKFVLIGFFEEEENVYQANPLSTRKAKQPKVTKNNYMDYQWTTELIELRVASFIFFRVFYNISLFRDQKKSKIDFRMSFFCHNATGNHICQPDSAQLTTASCLTTLN